MTGRTYLGLLLCLSTALLVAAVAPAPAANLLANPGFDDAADAPCVGGSDGANGTSYSWSYVFPAGGAYLWRESDRAVPHLHGIQACHHSSAIAGTAGNAEARMYQEVWVQPSASYTASVNVYGVAGLDPVNYPGIGFGSASTDTAGLHITEYNAAGAVVLDHAKVELKTATTDWANKSETFTTQATTRKIRFSCETKIACHWTIGRAVYDDCVLDGPAGTAPIAAVKGTVTTGSPVVPVAGATVTIGSTTVTTAADGTYSIPGLTSGAGVKVTVDKTGYYGENKYRTLVDGDNIVNFNLTLLAAHNLLSNGGFETNIYEYGEYQSSAHLSSGWMCQHMDVGTYLAYEKEGVRAPGFQHSGNDAATIATASDQTGRSVRHRPYVSGLLRRSR